MVTIKYFPVLMAVLGLSQTALAAFVQPRMINGSTVDTLERFAHHVTIEPIDDWNWNNSIVPTMCGGSIIKQRWILTSAKCVRGSSRLQLHFQRLYRNSTSGSYAIVVNNDERNVVVYPTGYDDIALVNIPVNLIFSNSMQPIYLSQQHLSQLQGKLAILPGFDAGTASTPSSTISTSSSLTYSMLRVVSNSMCKSAYKPGTFDEYNDMCCTSWGNNPNAPCISDLGCGLIVGWPAKPELIGIYSGSSFDCDSSNPSAYTNVQKYISWIDSVTMLNP